MDEGEENGQGSEFVERLESMSDEEVSTNFYDLFNEALELHPEDKK